MKYFYGIAHKDEDSAYGIEFPDLSGCFSAADEIDDLVPNAIEAITLWFEDEERVEPSSIESVRAAAADALAKGAFIVAVPWIVPSGRLARVNLSLDEAMLAAIDEAAVRRRQTRSGFLVDAARELMARG